MKKKLILLFAFLLLVIGNIFYFLPRPLNALAGNCDALSIVKTTCTFQSNEADTDDETDPDYKPDIQTESHSISTDSDQYKQISTLLSNYQYHRYFRTLFKTDVVSLPTGDPGYSFQIYVYHKDDVKMILVLGDGRLLIDDRLYKMDFRGNKKQLAFMNELNSILQK